MATIRSLLFFISMVALLWATPLSLCAKMGKPKPQHPIKLSLAEVHYNPSKNRIEVAIKIFEDDLGEVLKQPLPLTEQQVKQYLSANFVFTTPSQQFDLQWLGKENEGQALWCYVYVEVAAWPPNLILTNTLLITWPGQTNIVRLKINNTSKSYIFDQENTQQTLTKNQ